MSVRLEIGYACVGRNGQGESRWCRRPCWDYRMLTCCGGSQDTHDGGGNGPLASVALSSVSEMTTERGLGGLAEVEHSKADDGERVTGRREWSRW